LEQAVKKLVAIGFWNDGSVDCPMHNPQEFVDEYLDPPVREAMAHYLRSGVECAQYLGRSWCRFGCEASSVVLGSADLTDGVWMWPEGLAHYVEHHAVGLPDPFVEFARARGFELRFDGLDQPAQGDLGFWTEWCDVHSNEDPEAISRWRRSAQEIEAAMKEIVGRLVEKHGGLGTAACSWIGCERLVLNGLAFCPECAHTRMQLWP
jgi:hypothetical protein